MVILTSKNFECFGFSFTRLYPFSLNILIKSVLEFIPKYPKIVEESFL